MKKTFLAGCGLFLFGLAWLLLSGATNLYGLVMTIWVVVLYCVDKATKFLGFN